MYRNYHKLPAAATTMAHRHFRDSLGRAWDVWDVTPSKVERRNRSKPALPPNPPGIERRRRDEYRVLLGERWSNGWLAFETRGQKRRLAPIPEGWEMVSAGELETLCNEATEVTPSRRLVE